MKIKGLDDKFRSSGWWVKRWTCSECGFELPGDADKMNNPHDDGYAFCPYCGMVMLVHNKEENS